MNTRPDDTIPTDKWVGFTDLGIAVAIGKAITIQNVAKQSRGADSHQSVRVWIGPTRPADNFWGGRRIAVNAVADITANESEVWLRAEQLPTEVNIDYVP